jgi:ubiquinone/menaquinone biosynthesis C-methylase UbiE
MGQTQVKLTQRGRAGMQFLGHLRGIASSDLRDRAREDFEQDSDGQALSATAASMPDASYRDWMKVVRDASHVAERSDAYRFERFYQYVGGHEIFSRGICAIEECRDEIERARAEESGDSDGTTLDLQPGLPEPRYFPIEWHTQPGGWDGYDLYGEMFQYAFGPNVFRYGGYAVVETGQQTRYSREEPFGELPPGRYQRIYEVGCGTGGSLFSARAVFPDAELIGSDLSETQLRHGVRLSRQAGAGIQLKQRLAHDTQEPSDSVDAAISFAFFHELPRQETLRVLEEMYRILRPGGSMIIVDPPPFKEVDLFQSVIMDWESLHHGEPYFSVSCASHWGAEMKKIGFENVREKAFHDRNKYPYVTVGTKPGHAS